MPGDGLVETMQHKIYLWVWRHASGNRKGLDKTYSICEVYIFFPENVSFDLKKVFQLSENIIFLITLKQQIFCSSAVKGASLL